VVATVAFFFLAGESDAWHTSYGLIAVPAIAWAAGAGFALAQARVAALRGPLVVGVVLASVVGYGFGRHGWRTPREAIESLDAAKALLDRIAPGAPLFVVSDGDPKMFWYLDRRGEIVPQTAVQERLGSMSPPPAVAARRGTPGASVLVDDTLGDGQAQAGWCRGPTSAVLSTVVLIGRVRRSTLRALDSPR
jgi:hypothetical protein